MTKNYIIDLIEAGRLPVDMLSVMIPIMAKQYDVLVPDLINYVTERRLWARWGFTSSKDFIERSGIPVPVQQCSTILLLRDWVQSPGAEQSMPTGVRREILRLLEDRPMEMSSEQFLERLDGILVEQYKALGPEKRAMLVRLGGCYGHRTQGLEEQCGGMQ